jgi:hypothetical protein
VNRRTVLLRVGLIYGAYLNGSVGVWATVAPRSFYDRFPGLGRVWVAIDGPYNEHLVRDVGALGLALAVVLLAAAWTLSRPLLLAAGAGMTVAAVPHTLYHLRHAGVYTSNADAVVSLTGLVLGTLLGIAVLIVAMREEPVFHNRR